MGQGVYFFDDYRKARWWANSSSMHNANCGAIIYQASIEAPKEKTLDLDHQLDEFLTYAIEFIKEAKRECKGNMPIFYKEQFRGVLFDYYKSEKNISVIVGTFQKDKAGYTQRRSIEDSMIQSELMNVIGIRFLERQICVSDKECIKNTQMVYNEEEEVI